MWAAVTSQGFKFVSAALLDIGTHLLRSLLLGGGGGEASRLGFCTRESVKRP
jgi:hypothetical protein